jgi:hypothetical protein
MKYLKYFEQASAYEAYKTSSDYVTPNVSYIEDTKGVKYNPASFETKNIICTYIIDEYSVNTPIKLIHNDGCLNWDDSEKKYPIIIDGTPITDDDIADWNDGLKYVFSSTGIHTVEYIPYTFEVEENGESFISFETGYNDGYDNYSMFNNCANLYSVKIPNVAERIIIFDATFINCNNLKEIDLSENVKSIGISAFENCYNLSNIIIRSTTPPEISKDTFYLGDNMSEKIIINVPSIDNYQTWANNTDAYYPGYYSKIEFKNI